MFRVLVLVTVCLVLRRKGEVIRNFAQEHFSDFDPVSASWKQIKNEKLLGWLLRLKTEARFPCIFLHLNKSKYSGNLKSKIWKLSKSRHNDNFEFLPPSWYTRPNPEDRINRKPDDQKYKKKRKTEKNSSTVLYLIFFYFFNVATSHGSSLLY